MAPAQRQRDRPAAGAEALWVTPALITAAHVASDALLVIDRSLIVVFANSAAERLAGHGQGDLIGLDAREALGPWAGDPDALEPWHRLCDGQPWHGYLPGPARQAGADGVEIIPVLDPAGTVATYLAVLRPDRHPGGPPGTAGDPADAELWSLVGSLTNDGGIEGTATALCESFSNVEGLDGVMILLLPPTGDLVHVSSVGPALPGFEPGAQIPLERLQLLAESIAAGPWHLDLAAPPARDLIGPALVEGMLAAGISAVAYAPIWAVGRVTGVLAVASTAPDGAQRLGQRLDLLGRLGSVAGAVLGHESVEFGRIEAIRQDVRGLIAGQRFHPVFQPIVSLSTGEVHGYEALTRFADGRRPDLVFSDAHLAGMGVELEEACAQVALRAGQALAPLPVNVNLSPAAVLSDVVAGLVDGFGRQLVVEITEHAPIASYAAVHDRLSGTGDVEVAVDDAGAGFASLRHILELRPDYVKLDMALVRGVDTDPARAALVAGMRYFAETVGIRLVAEGVETAAEARALADLGVPLAQGYLFGRPRPL